MSNIFGGGRFFLSRAIPQRTQLKETIEKHGGSVVLLEKDADIILVDHLRKTQTIPPNALSYRYVEKSVRQGKLEDPASHRVGPAAPRPMGASNIPIKSTRRSYTLEDDRIVFDWLYPWEQARGAPTHGNNIYKNLAERFPHHTWQSWRTRYLKTLRGKPRPGGGDPRPDLIYGGPEAVPRCGQPSPAPQTPLGLPGPAAPPAQHTSRPNYQHSPPASSSRKRGPPAKSPQPSDTANTAKRRLVDVQKISPSAAQSSQNRSPDAATRPLGIAPREPSGQPRDISVPVPEHPRPRNPSISAQTIPAETDEAPKETVDPFFQHLPFFPSTPEPETEDDDDGSDPEDYPDVNSWVQAQVARGADVSTVLDALRYTSMEPSLARKLLNVLVAGNPVPDNMRGVWTEEDDRCLESPNARDIERVTKKHGKRLFQARWEYLEMARERGLVE
ncbi:hypothetical protein PMG11_05285 [Penicillium brasilianum]|uniref:DNA-binding protein RAP1 n=1 Tax=Penicillium brasilianum TaxID=104259 RepID=A0A0F7VJ60_PENBI|nr:hypothetical protein PMG11_05285 [Penicillium brasilianum]